MSYDAWLTHTPLDDEHEYECNCEECHRYHLENDFIDRAKDSEFVCCQDEVEVLISKGKLCAKHPESYFEPATEGHKAYCERCCYLNRV